MLRLSYSYIYILWSPQHGQVSASHRLSPFPLCGTFLFLLQDESERASLSPASASSSASVLLCCCGSRPWWLLLCCDSAVNQSCSSQNGVCPVPTDGWMLGDHPSSAAAAGGDNDNVLCPQNCHQCPGWVRKTVFLSHLYINATCLPRQARDKHRESSFKKTVLCRSCLRSRCAKRTCYDAGFLFRKTLICQDRLRPDKIDGIFTERKCIVRRRRNGSPYRCEKTVLVSSMPC